jgi:hypothetical protein
MSKFVNINIPIPRTALPPILYRTVDKNSSGDHTILLAGRKTIVADSEDDDRTMCFAVNVEKDDKPGLSYYGECSLDDTTLYEPLPADTILTIIQP